MPPPIAPRVGASLRRTKKRHRAAQMPFASPGQPARRKILTRRAIDALAQFLAGLEVWNEFIRRPAPPCTFRINSFHTSSPARNCASASIARRVRIFLRAGWPGEANGIWAARCRFFVRRRLAPTRGAIGGGMKRVFYLVVIVVTLLFGVTFAFQNRQDVQLAYYFGLHWHGPLSLALLATLAIGIGVGYLAGLR